MSEFKMPGVTYRTKIRKPANVHEREHFDQAFLRSLGFMAMSFDGLEIQFSGMFK